MAQIGGNLGFTRGKIFDTKVVGLGMNKLKEGRRKAEERQKKGRRKAEERQKQGRRKAEE